MADKGKGFWTGKSFEVPVTVKNYDGELPARVMVYAFWLASVRSPFYICGGHIRLNLRMDTLAKRVSSVPHRVREALGELAADTVLERFEDTGDIRLPVMGGTRAICTANGVPCLKVPEGALPVLLRLTATALRVYIVLLELAGEMQATSFTYDRTEVRKRTGLSRPSFNQGERVCITNKLIQRKGDHWTMAEPLTMKPKKPRKPAPKLTPEQWRDILVFAMGETYDTADFRRFLKSNKTRKCPFCPTPGRISVIYDGTRGSGFKCFACGSKGRLGKLLRKHLGIAETKPLWPQIQFFLKVIGRGGSKLPSSYTPQEQEALEEVTV